MKDGSAKRIEISPIHGNGVKINGQLHLVFMLSWDRGGAGATFPSHCRNPSQRPGRKR